MRGTEKSPDLMGIIEATAQWDSNGFGHWRSPLLV